MSRFRPPSPRLQCWSPADSRRHEIATFWRFAAAASAVWTIALAVSTLLTKQHVVVDIVAGLAFGLVVAMLGMWSLGVVEGPLSRQSRSPRTALHLPSVVAFVVEWTLIVAAIAVAIRWWNGPVIVFAALFIATRQHAILVLYHDGVHCLVARSRRVNDFIVNSVVGVPLLLPIHLYRALHLSHHRHLGAACDPERVLLYRGQPWTFRPLAARRAGAAARRRRAGLERHRHDDSLRARDERRGSTEAAPDAPVP